MISVRANDKVFDLISDWSEVSLADFIELSKIEIPDKLLRLYQASAKMNTSSERQKNIAKREWDAVNEEITEQDLIKSFPEYYGRVISLLSTMPEDIIDLLTGEQRTILFDNYFRQFVLSLFMNYPLKQTGSEMELYDPPKITRFKLNKEEYLFPANLMVGGTEIPLGTEPIISFAEAADIDLAIRGLSQGGASQFPLFMSVYCRKEGEEYNQISTLKRQDEFLDAKMDVVWSLFFYTEKRIHVLSSSIASYLNPILTEAGRGVIGE